MAVGDTPDLAFLPEEFIRNRGYVVTDDCYQTSDPQVFTIGDAVRRGC